MRPLALIALFASIAFGQVPKPGSGASGSGSGGVGAAITQGTASAIPAACSTNDLYLPTDSVYTLLRCSASNTWSYFINGFLATPPPTTCTWINQNTATSSTANGGLYIEDAGLDTLTTNLKVCLLSSGLASTFTATASIFPHLGNNDFANGGIVIRESATGKGYAFNLFMESNARHLVVLSESVFSSASTEGVVADVAWQSIGWEPVVLQVVVTPTTITFLAGNSANPNHAIKIAQISKTATFTVGPNQAGIDIHARNATNIAGIWLANWTVQ